MKRHSTLKHNLKVCKIQRITKEDMKKLDEYQDKFQKLSEKHKELDVKFNLQVKSYTDPEIYSKYGPDVNQQMYSIYTGFLELRQEIEQFLESKYLPMDYPESTWLRPFIGVESGSRNYDGKMIECGFDSGPAKWCSNTLYFMMNELHRRLHLQRIELYSKAGLVVGVISLVTTFVLSFI